ncbi:cell cycle checkpoint control protein RAD9B isoform X1 [Scleropages formosus]|uniref:Cell cycle checkpoint control protein RAD9A n=1 Tax=Scleropages formosus TaxID=113540 RepID=A0A8C9RDP1_SCLFO|nr:cell cycle checkpoint control protein RAD9B isoform X1 [Scleropages formosus]
MKCIFEGARVKVFGRAVHALSRISDEFWLDPLSKGLALRSVNSSHSAYACFLFPPLFFQSYHPISGLSQDATDGKCKLAVKSLLPLFRCVPTADRSEEMCQISTSPQDNRVVFKLACKHGIIKTYKLAFRECEVLQAVFPAHQCPNVLKAQASLLGDMVMHFPVSQEEVTLSVSPKRVMLRNYCEDKMDQMKAMSTELSLQPEEFDCFQVAVSSDITFCLKELRGVLSFAESHGLPVSMHFGCPGKPVCFSVEDVSLEVTVVLSTLTDPSQTTEPEVPPAPSCDVSMTLHHGSAVENLTEHVTHALLNGEQVPSSQGSSIFSGLDYLGRVASLRVASIDPGDSNAEGCWTLDPGSQTTPKVCSVLFGSVSGQQVGGRTPPHASLVCASDTDEDTEEERALPIPRH